MSLLSARCADGSPVCAVAVGFRLNAIGSENAGKTSLRPKYREMLDVSCTDLYNDIIVIYHYHMTMSFYRSVVSWQCTPCWENKTYYQRVVYYYLWMLIDIWSSSLIFVLARVNHFDSIFIPYHGKTWIPWSNQ